MDPTTPICEIASAKLNLALHVRGRRDDGYHEIESIFVHTTDGDELCGQPADRFSLTLTGPFAGDCGPEDDNLVTRAANGLAKRLGRTADVALTLDKRLPVASGMGGGSSDAAAALRLLGRLWGVALDDPAVMATARALGADVPGCMSNAPKRVTGIGHEQRPVDGAAFAGASVLLVNPRVAVSTPAVFKAWDGIDRGPLPDPFDRAAMLASRNDLAAPARELAPVIAEVETCLRALEEVVLVRMSGSGATVFALFNTMAACDRAAGAVRAGHPGWWVHATRLATGGTGQ